MQTDLERCPLCNSELLQTKFREIRAKQRAEDERRAAEMAEAKAALSAAMEQEFKNKLEQMKRETERKAREQAEQQVKKLLFERDEMASKLQTITAREAEFRKQNQAEMERQKQVAEKKGRAEAQEELKKVTLERDRTAAKLKEAEARETAIRKEAEQKAEKLWQAELLAQREVLAKDKNNALLKQQSEHNREREALQRKLTVVEHQLQKKTANELGDGGEIDVFESLRDAFPGDKIARVQKGHRGADILQEVLYKGEVCGRIVVDVKIQQGWQNSYVTKLRQDKVEAKAEHAILATTVFPAGKRELCIEPGVIVISPPHVVHIAHLLRQAMVTVHIRGLSSKERATKINRLYDFIVSQSYRTKFTEANRLADDIMKVDEQEMTAHTNVWKRRGALVKRMQYVLREIDTEVSAITEGDEGPEQVLSLVDDKDMSSGPAR